MTGSWTRRATLLVIWLGLALPQAAAAAGATTPADLNLRADELPAGYSVASTNLWNDTQFAAETGRTVAELQAEGRVLTSFVEFQKASGLGELTIQAEVISFASAAQAKAKYATLAPTGAGLVLPSQGARQTDAPSIGQQAATFRGYPDFSNVRQNASCTMFVEGVYLAYAQQYAPLLEPGFAVDAVVPLAQRIDGRIRAAARGLVVKAPSGTPTATPPPAPTPAAGSGTLPLIGFGVGNASGPSLFVLDPHGASPGTAFYYLLGMPAMIAQTATLQYTRTGSTLHFNAVFSPSGSPYDGRILYIDGQADLAHGRLTAMIQGSKEDDIQTGSQPGDAAQVAVVSSASFLAAGMHAWDIAYLLAGGTAHARGEQAFTASLASALAPPPGSSWHSEASGGNPNVSVNGPVATARGYVGFSDGFHQRVRLCTQSLGIEQHGWRLEGMTCGALQPA